MVVFSECGKSKPLHGLSIIKCPFRAFSSNERGKLHNSEDEGCGVFHQEGSRRWRKEELGGGGKAQSVELAQLSGKFLMKFVG